MRKVASNNTLAVSNLTELPDPVPKLKKVPQSLRASGLALPICSPSNPWVGYNVDIAKSLDLTTPNSRNFKAFEFCRPMLQAITTRII